MIFNDHITNGIILESAKRHSNPWPQRQDERVAILEALLQKVLRFELDHATGMTFTVWEQMQSRLDMRPLTSEEFDILERLGDK